MSDAEATIASSLSQGDLRAAASATVVAYGGEILGLLHALLRDDALAEDAYSLFAERLWTTLPRFEAKCSMRTWAYLLARHAARDVRRQQRRVVGLTDAGVYDVAMQVRTATLPHLRTENRDAIARLRDELPEDDRMLLVLRVDRELAWNELALVFLDEDDRSDATLKREAARLRKRFQLVKERLYALGRERGLLI